MKLPTVLAVGFMVALANISGAAMAAGDAASGKKVFNKCKACHALEAGKNKIGPSLAGVFGRKAGTAPGFKKFSDPMKASGLVWSDETMKAFLANPKKSVPGTTMRFAGLKKPADIDNLMAYLKAAAK